MKILVTGASGHVAQMGIPGLAKNHDLRLADIVAPPALPGSATFHHCDLLRMEDADLAKLPRRRAMFTGWSHRRSKGSTPS